MFSHLQFGRLSGLGTVTYVRIMHSGPNLLSTSSGTQRDSNEIIHWRRHNKFPCRVQWDPTSRPVRRRLNNRLLSPPTYWIRNRQLKLIQPFPRALSIHLLLPFPFFFLFFLSFFSLPNAFVNTNLFFHCALKGDCVFPEILASFLFHCPDRRLIQNPLDTALLRWDESKSV